MKKQNKLDEFLMAEGFDETALKSLSKKDKEELKKAIDFLKYYYNNNNIIKNLKERL